jgi:drug/metabolite transporter (DMT)-like permease
VSIDRTTLAAFLLMVVLAGGNAVSITIARQELDPYWAAILRFGTAGLLFTLLMVALRSPAPRGMALVGAVAYGILGFGLAFGIAFVALPMTGAGAGQLLLGLVPLLTLILAPLHGLERYRLRPLIGSLVALVGIAILTADRIELHIPLLGIALAFAVALLLAEAGIVVKLTPRADPIATNAVGMLAGALILIPLSLILGESWILPTRAETWLAMTYLVVPGSLGVFWLFVFVLRRWTATAASFEFLLIPLATIPFSALLTGEVIDPLMLVGGAIILAGVYVGALAPDANAAAAEPADA